MEQCFLFSYSHRVYFFTHLQDVVSKAITVLLLVSIWVVSRLSCMYIQGTCAERKECFPYFLLVSFEFSGGVRAPILVQLRQMSEPICISMHENKTFDSMYTTYCTIFAPGALLTVN